MEVWGITHRGVVRKENQDAFAYERLSDGRVITVVCDGMGGALAGNVASSMAVKLFLEEFLKPVDWKESDQRRMERSAALANIQVFNRSAFDPSCSGMGTTLVAALAGPDQAVILNEGDSRAYYIRPGFITRVTRDHSLVEDLVERGELTREQARVHPQRNLITRALGIEPYLRSDAFYQALAPGECLLLCSDGLSNIVTEEEILHEVMEDGAETCCQRLLDLALQRGAPDNVTTVLIRSQSPQ